MAFSYGIALTPPNPRGLRPPPDPPPVHGVMLRLSHHTTTSLATQHPTQQQILANVGLWLGLTCHLSGVPLTHPRACYSQRLPFPGIVALTPRKPMFLGVLKLKTSKNAKKKFGAPHGGGCHWGGGVL